MDWEEQEPEEERVVVQLMNPKPECCTARGLFSTQLGVAHETERGNRSPAPFGRDDQVDWRRKAWAP